jgi:hypothetical protein
LKLNAVMARLDRATWTSAMTIVRFVQATMVTA